MKLTKYAHACLLIENADENILFDPGIYSYQSGLLNFSTLPKLTYVVITHEHADHFHMAFLEELILHSPDLIILTTKSVATMLEDNVTVEVRTDPFANFEIFNSQHEPLPIGSSPENIGVHYTGQLTHPGDSHTFEESKRILAMPMTAPWGSMTDAVKKIVQLKPEIVIPIHDWHWRPEALLDIYEGIRNLLAKENIDFKIPVDGKPLEV